MRAKIFAAIIFAACHAATRVDMTGLAEHVRAGDVPAIRQLLHDGVDPNAPSGGNGWTPLLHAIHTHQNGSIAALIDGGADPNRADADGTTPLMMAAGYGYDDTVQLLLQRGAKAS